MEFGSTFVEVLNRKIRKEKVITQVELARVMGVTPVAVANWLKKGSLDIDKVPRLCAALNITPNEFFDYKGDVTNEKVIALIKAYDSHPEYRAAINKLLGLK